MEYIESVQDTLIAVGSNNGKIALFKDQNPRDINLLQDKGLGSKVSCLDIVSSGKTLVAGYDCNLIVLWNLEKSKIKLQI